MGTNMKKKIIIIGAVALGPKVGCRLRRLDPDAEITIIDKDTLISYGGCGIPYYVGGDINDIEGLCSTSSHVIRDCEFFKSNKGITVLLQVEATAINPMEKTISIRHLSDDRMEELPYDKLVIATGAAPIRPPIEGAHLPGVFTVADLHSAKQIKDKISKARVAKAVVIGAGAIGIEMAEALTDLWDVETYIIEMADQVLPTTLGRNMSKLVANQLEKQGIHVLLNEKVMAINGDDISGVKSVQTSSETIDCDIIVMSAGVRPNTDFAVSSGLARNNNGALLVDQCMKTSDPDIYAGGDCVALRNLVSGETMAMPLGSLANRQGRIIANNIHGRATQFKGMVGTFCIKVFELSVATAGLTFSQAKANGFDPVHAIVSQPDRAHFYPSAKLMYIELIADRKTRKILGIEAAGFQADAVKGRVDAVAPLLGNGIDVDDVSMLETGYAPPFASAMDILNNAGNVLDNILENRNHPVDAESFIEQFKGKTVRVLDVRESKEADPFTKKFNGQWLNIPQSELSQRLHEIPRDESLCLVCGTGARSYECQTLLNHAGFNNICNVQGGYAMIQLIDPNF
jgi:NADPH-dependent 2,4-dienoyl-CoA reductase/sulfur reductase-like enzyme/rhodanese-related sulfurtransferase